MMTAMSSASQSPRSLSSPCMESPPPSSHSFASSHDASRVHHAVAPAFTLRKEMSLWQAFCEPTDEMCSLSNITQEQRKRGPALTDCNKERTWCFDDLRIESARLAAGLQASLGDCRGRRIMLCMPSIPETLFLVLAVCRMGGVAVMCNAEYVGQELQHTIDTAEPYAIVCLSKSAGILGELTEGLNVELLSFSDPDEVWSFAVRHEYLSELPLAQPRSWYETTLIVFSSGTSGLPKAVELSHRSLISVFLLGLSATYFNMAKREIAFLSMPAYHIGGICSWVLNTLRGDHCVFASAQRPVSFEKWSQAIIRWRCNKFSSTPTGVRAFVKSGLAEEIGAAGCLTCVSVGAGSMSPWLHGEAQRLFNCPVLANWGMSEIAGAVIRGSAYLPCTPGSVGRLSGDVRARIVDEEGGDVVKGAGELLIQSPTMMNGYLNNPQATMQTVDSEGWLHTGDLAYFNDDGELFIVDRIKDMIKYKGWSIAPAELEAILESHPRVAEAAVVGVAAGESDGDKPRAYVVLKGGAGGDHDILVEELLGLVKENTSPSKWLRGGIEILAQLPKNGSSKVLKRELRQRALPV